MCNVNQDLNVHIYIPYNFINPNNFPYPCNFIPGRMVLIVYSPSTLHTVVL